MFVEKLEILKSRYIATMKFGLEKLISLVFLLSPIQNPWYLCWVVPFLCLFPLRSWILLTGLVGLYYLDFYFDYQEIQSWTKWTPWFEYLPFYLLLIWDLCNKNNILGKEKKNRP